MKKNKKNNNSNNEQINFKLNKLDKILLDPKKYRNYSIYISYFALFLIICFILNQWFANNTPIYWPIMGILIGLTIIVVIFCFVFSFLKAKKYAMFNKIDHTLELLNEYKNNDAIENLVINENNIIPNKSLISSIIPKSFEYTYSYNEINLKFKNEPNLYYVTNVYVSKLASANFSMYGDKRKIVIIKLDKPLSADVFYIAKQTLNFDNSGIIVINDIDLIKTKSFDNYFIFESNVTQKSYEKFNHKLLNDLIFNSKHFNNNFDIFNDGKNAYLICYVIPSFMNTILLPTESVLNFKKNLNKQSEYDLMILKFFLNIKKILETDFLVH